MNFDQDLFASYQVLLIPYQYLYTLSISLMPDQFIPPSPQFQYFSPNCHNYFLRAISTASASEPIDQFVHLVKTVNVVSENQAQLGHVVRALQDKDKMRDCEDCEEKEGRMNCDLLDRFVIIGGPFIDPGPNLQSQFTIQLTCYYKSLPLLV